MSRVSSLNLLKHLPDGWKSKENPCPRCHHRTLQVKEHSFHCWYCGWHGGVWEFWKEIRQDDRLVQQMRQERMERSFLYQQVFHWLMEYREEGELYLRRRGIDPEVYPFAYCPPGVLERKLTQTALIKWGLASENGYNLLSGRVVFPVYAGERIVHFQGRSLDPDEKLRWCSTIGQPTIQQYLFNAQRYHQELPFIFLAEGITDTLTLLSLGLPAVGTFGIYPPFRLWEKTLKLAQSLILCYDRDRHPIGHPQAEQYISWVPVLKLFGEVYPSLPGRAYALLPKGKDVNDWFLQGLEVGELQSHLEQAPSIEQFVLDENFPWWVQVCILRAGRDPEAIATFRKRYETSWWEHLVACWDT